MLRRRNHKEELPFRHPSAVGGHNGYSAAKYKKSNSLGPFTIFVSACIIAILLYSLSRLTSGGSDSNNSNANPLDENNNNNNDIEKYHYGVDTNEHCNDWAKKNECMNNRSFMLPNCPHSCNTVAGVNIDNLPEKILLEDAKKGFAYFRYEGDDSDDEDEFGACSDKREDCFSLASDGKCLEDEEFRDACRKSCLVCFGSKPQTVTINFGVEQDIDSHVDAIDSHKIMEVIESTHDYMVNEVFGDEEYEDARKDCRNLDPDCSFYAASGECHGEIDAIGMQQNCAPACHACHGLEYWRRCMKRPDDVDALQPGGVSELFERIVQNYAQYNPTVISKPDLNKKKIMEEKGYSSEDDPGSWEDPWIVTLDDFITREECDWFIAKGYEVGWEDTSEITNEITEGGDYGAVVGQGRSSKHFWCDEGCDDQPIVSTVIDRILETVEKFPRGYLESTEILKYEEGGHFEPHHDVIPTHVNQRCGARILTMYLFFSDVEEGGEIRFSEMDGDVKVQPKKGRVVLWNNMGDHDFGSLLTKAFHEAMPVTKGRKYGANQWFHMRDFSAAFNDNCCLG